MRHRICEAPDESDVETRRGSGSHVRAALIEGLAEAPVELLRPKERLAERFLVEYLAASGGMGAIYRGKDLETGAPVAIKVVARSRRASNERFAVEARVLAELSHPAIVRYIAHGTSADGTPFMAMEWLEGEDLSVRLAGQGLSVEESLSLARKLCSALAAAHERGIVHRDLKPSNVFLVEHSAEAIKLLDFGIARQDMHRRLITRTGAVLGTVGYMAPEQASGEVDVDARADVFALGCLLFECLSGRPAFSGVHDVAVLAKVLRDAPPRLRDLRPDLPAELDELTARLLQKERADRPRDAGEVLRMLSALPTALGPAPVRVALGFEHGGASESEQRISSVILGRPRNLHSPTITAGTMHELQSLDELSRNFGVESIPLQGGALLQIVTALVPVTAVDQAMQAARCALRLHQLRPELILGVATGGVDTSSNMPVGVAIDRAAALVESAASENVIRLDALTAALLGTRFDVRRTKQGLCLFGELEEWEVPGVLMGKSTPFVGRAKEFDLLVATLKECLEERVARAMLVTAPPGLGKSRLGREFLQHVRTTSEARTIVARADPTSSGSALSLVQRLIRNAATLRASSSAEVQRARLHEYIAPLVGEETREQLFDFLAELIGIGAAHHKSQLVRAARSDPEVMREQKRRAFVTWIRAEAARGPLVILLEDLHWGDLPSVRYLQNVLPSLADRPLLLLSLARPEVHQQFPHLRQFTNLDELRLRALTPRASEQLARALLQTDTDAAVVARILALAEGNAFYLEELVRWISEGDSQLPESVVAMAQSRLERLPSDARRVLRAASVFGETAWKGGIESVLGLRDDADLQIQLTWLCEQEVLEERRDARFEREREYLFRHAFLREAAYAMLTEGDRRAAHRRAGAWLEARGERDALLLADHFERGDDAGRAIPWLVKAASAALDGGDFESATALARRGAGLGALGSDLGMLTLVRAYAAVWSMKEDLAVAAEALPYLPHGSGPWWLALSLHVFASSVRGRAELADPYLELALKTAPGAELTAAYGQAIQALAAGTALVGRAEVGWSLVQHLQPPHQREGSSPDLAFEAWLNLTRCVLASNSLRGEVWELGQAVTWGRASVEAMRALGSASGEAAALFHLGNAYCLLGSYQESEICLRQGRERALQIGNVLVDLHSQLLLAVFALRGGTREQALETLLRLTRSNNSNIAHGARAVLADSLMRQGKYEEAVRAAEVEVAGPALLYRRMAGGTLARGQLALGRPEAALTAVARALEQGAARAFPQCFLDLMSSRATALVALGRTAEAAPVIAEAVGFRVRCADAIEDAALQRAFLGLGQANARLDELAAAWLPKSRPERG